MGFICYEYLPPVAVAQSITGAVCRLWNKTKREAIKSTLEKDKVQTNSVRRVAPTPRTASKSKGVETLHPLKAGHSNKAFELRRPWTSNGLPLSHFIGRKLKVLRCFVRCGLCICLVVCIKRAHYALFCEMRERGNYVFYINKKTATYKIQPFLPLLDSEE